MDHLKKTLELDMNHVRLGTMDEYSLMTLFGSCHSQFLTNDLNNKPSEIKDVKGNVLYPAYFMTHLIVPVESALSSFSLWDKIEVGVVCRRYGDTILDSQYFAEAAEQQAPSITMAANSLFILDPSIYRSHTKQVSVPQPEQIVEMEKITEPPASIREAALVRTVGFEQLKQFDFEATPYQYKLESHRDTDPGHPLVFSKMPSLMELSERELLREYTRNKASESILDAVSLMERKTFYYGNAFSGSELTIYSKVKVNPCSESLWKENPRLVYLCKLTFQSEIYENGELIAISCAEKVIVHEIRHQTQIQDTKRLFNLGCI
ncbi:hypothetical protein [Aliikangiella sp. IMCC44359]|uniref:hypothetical protein n=1 Tax=Aliikangiella sp. IMCC44359 TaxID=3459125 RepID=UPI00403ABC34